jgi:hypothetical protein
MPARKRAYGLKTWSRWFLLTLCPETIKPAGQTKRQAVKTN